MWLSLPHKESSTRVFVPWYAILALGVMAASAVAVVFGDSDMRSVAGSIGTFAGNLAAGRSSRGNSLLPLLLRPRSGSCALGPQMRQVR